MYDRATRQKDIKRTGEFLDLTVEDLLAIRDPLYADLRDVKLKIREAIKSNQPITDLDIERKNLNNKRIRLYARLRKLGYRASDKRTKAPVESGVAVVA